MRIAHLFAALVAGSIAVAAGAQQPTRADLLVTPAWLSEHLKDPKVIVFQIGMMDDAMEFAEAHIPGAHYLDLDQISVSSMNHTDSLMLELPSAQSLRNTLASLGVSDDSRIVIYTAADEITHATRALLTLDYAGFGARSALLDGGLVAWKKAGKSVTSETVKPVAGHLSTLRINPVVISLTSLRNRVTDPSFHLIDARASVYYDGVEQGTRPTRKGHIAGAKNIPFSWVTDNTTHLKSAEELTKMFAAAGVGPRDTVVAYCHIGQQATAVLFAARTLGHPVLLFDGSFQEWGRNSALPVEVKK